MKLTTWIRKVLSDKFGYYVHEMKTMPVGTDYAADLKLKIQLDPKVIFDIGANIGQTVDFYRAVYPNTRIYSFEPIPDTFKRLDQHCKSYKNVVCHNLAFGEANETREIQIVNDKSSVLNSLSANFQRNLEVTHESWKKVTIEIATIDDFVFEHGIDQIDLLKIDTEGFEISVLKGAAKTLQKGNVSAIICEAGFMKSNQRNTYFGDINDLLESYGYALFAVYEMGHVGFIHGNHYGNLLYLSKNYRETQYKNWQVGYA